MLLVKYATGGYNDDVYTSRNRVPHVSIKKGEGVVIKIEKASEQANRKAGSEQENSVNNRQICTLTHTDTDTRARARARN